ncbi:MAG TPA: symmetrical bis(5'-nucleosyl)-tetraphosphatase [Steroidobacteraceae bacterium]|nr:symmetrical bis(5'-nucleosyl)-tetraphosphatase [Steroidobacteraceae bacterium]
MARYAIGDLQGCCDELKTLLARLDFSADRDELWFVGDLVNRGPQSLETLRFVRALGANATVVLGNHDLHLLALAYGNRRKQKDGDTLDDILGAPDRDQLLEWLLGRPLAVYDEPRGDFLVHAGIAPAWTPRQAAKLAREVEAVLREDARTLFDGMYGNKPNKWDANLRGMDRLRFVINVFTRMRYVSLDGTVDLKQKGKPGEQAEGFVPWFDAPERASRDVRVVCGHWSTLGFKRRQDLIALDTGCVWGGSLTAVNLDAEAAPVQLACRGHQLPGGGEG